MRMTLLMISRMMWTKKSEYTDDPQILLFSCMQSLLIHTFINCWQHMFLYVHDASLVHGIHCSLRNFFLCNYWCITIIMFVFLRYWIEECLGDGDYNQWKLGRALLMQERVTKSQGSSLEEDIPHDASCGDDATESLGMNSTFQISASMYLGLSFVPYF